MKKAAIGFGLLLLVCAAALMVAAWRFEAKIRPNTMLGSLNLGGLTPTEASQRLHAWWMDAQDKDVQIVVPGQSRLVKLKLVEFKLGLDEAASIAQIPVSDFIESAKQAVGAGRQGEVFSLKFTTFNLPTSLRKVAEREVTHPVPARVIYKGGRFERIPEKSGQTIDAAALEAELMQAVDSSKEITLPVKEAPKQVPDEMLAQITDVESEFTTKFPTYKVDRNTNIRLAASKLNGVVIPPGGKVSFNNTVGRRTIAAGFKEAPVFKNGKHDLGVGGGICQVSSTLYNAALFSDLKIAERHNHSMPVPYLPVGRDATVDYGALDLVIENNQATPIALNSELDSGRLTFRILGKKDATLSVKIESSDSKSWDPGTKKVQDPKLPLGKTKVIEKGTHGRSINTYRIVYKNGVQVTREPLGRSYYKGGIRVIAVGTKPTAAPAVSVPGLGLPVQPQTPASPGPPIR